MVLSRIPGKIHHHLRTLRTERGLTLKQVSEGTGLSVSTLHAIEKGRPATLITAFKLSHFYGLSVENIWEPLFQQICQETYESGRDCEAFCLTC
jgi:transcriptional regulator with XRE-family HTH domain